LWNYTSQRGKLLLICRRGTVIFPAIVAGLIAGIGLVARFILQSSQNSLTNHEFPYLGEEVHFIPDRVGLPVDYF